MRSAVDTAPVTLREEYVTVRKAGQDLDVRTSHVLTATECCIHSTRAMLATGEARVMSRLASVRAPSHTTATLVRSLNVLMTASVLEDATLRQGNVLAQRGGMGLRVSSTRAPRTAMPRPPGTVTVSQGIVCAKWDTSASLVKSPPDAACHRTLSRSKTGILCGISQAGLHAPRASSSQGFEGRSVSR